MRRFVPFVLLFALSLAACQSDPPTADEDEAVSAGKGGPGQAPDLATWLGEQNRYLASKGLSLNIIHAEYLTAAESGQAGRIVYASDRGNKQLATDFVPADPRRRDGAVNLTYYVDNNRPSEDLPVADTEAAIDRAMTSWDGLTCSTLGLTKVPFDRRTATGFVSKLYGYRGSLDYVADVTHAGWLPAGFFDLVAPQGSTYILGVTFTIVFTDEEGALTDLDGNGKADVAWREIFYNDAFPWRIDRHYDVETIALHEAGHGLSQGHFGDIFVTEANNTLHFSPLAVMNAAYSGLQQELTTTDSGGHCSNWAEWPNN